MFKGTFFIIVSLPVLLYLYGAWNEGVITGIGAGASRYDLSLHPIKFYFSFITWLLAGAGSLIYGVRSLYLSWKSKS